MGMIINGKYYKKTDVTKLQNRQQSTYKNHEHNRQRKDFSREIVQPYNSDGTPNQSFVEAWPEESKEYGFIKEVKDG